MRVDDVAWPSSWRSVPLWSLFRRIKDVGHPDETMLSVYRDHGVVRKESRVDNFNKTAENRNIYQLVDLGWLIVNRMKAWQGSLGISPHRGIVSGHYICFRPEHQEDPRFLDYLLRSTTYAAALRQLSRGVRPNQIEIDNDWLRVLPVHLPAVPIQRAIADFLDAETARIDRVAGKRRQMADLLVERLRSMVDHRTGIGEPTRVRHITSLITSGPRGWGERVGDVGAPFIRSQNLRRDGMALRPEGLGRVWDEATPEAKRSRVHADDTVIGITGANTGWVGAVTAPFADGYVSQHVAILRPHGIDPRWLTYSLFSRRAQEQLLAGQYGGTKQQLGLSDLAELAVFVPELAAQQRIIRELDRAVEVQGRLDEALSLQNSLLEERRQAIITAAVTGELKVA